MNAQTLVIVLAILGLFALIIYLMVRYERRGRDDNLRISRALGFAPLTEIDEATCSRLINLHQHTESQDLHLEQLGERFEGSTRWLVFDLVDHSGDSNSTLVDRGLAVFSEDLRMPRFSIIPRLAEKGRLNDFANSVLERLIEKRKNRIRLETNTHFDERYFLLGDDVASITEFLNDFLLSRLSQSTYRHIEADGDCFTYSRFVFSAPTKRDRQADLKRDISEARVLIDLLSAK